MSDKIEYLNEPRQDRTLEVKVQDDCFEVINTVVEKYPFMDFDKVLHHFEMAHKTNEINIGRTEVIVKDLKDIKEKVDAKKEEVLAAFKKELEEAKAKQEEEKSEESNDASLD